MSGYGCFFYAHPRLNLSINCSYFRKPYCNIILQVSQITQTFLTHILPIKNMEGKKLLKKKNISIYRSSHPEVFLAKKVLKIRSKFTGEHQCRSAISIKLLCNFIKTTLRHGCFPVNLLHIFRTPFTKNTSERLLLHLSFDTAQKMKFCIKDFFSECDKAASSCIFTKKYRWKTSIFVYCEVLKTNKKRSFCIYLLKY